MDESLVPAPTAQEQKPKRAPRPRSRTVMMMPLRLQHASLLKAISKESAYQDYTTEPPTWRDKGRMFEAVLERLYWVEVIMPLLPPRLPRIISRMSGDKPKVQVRYDDGTVAHVGLGDKLAGGFIVVKLADDEVIVKRGSNTAALRQYHGSEADTQEAVNSNASPKQVEKAKEFILQILTDGQKEVLDELQRMKKLAEDHGVEGEVTSRANGTNGYAYEEMVPISSPGGRQFLKYLDQLDQLFLTLDLLWLNNVLDQRTRDRAQEVWFGRASHVLQRLRRPVNESSRGEKKAKVDRAVGEGADPTRRRRAKAADANALP